MPTPLKLLEPEGEVMLTGFVNRDAGGLLNRISISK
jgi:hypothetical protein